MDREALCAVIKGSQRVGHDWATELNWSLFTTSVSLFSRWIHWCHSLEFTSKWLLSVSCLWFLSVGSSLDPSMFMQMVNCTIFLFSLFFFLFFFWCGPFWKSLLGLLQYTFCFTACAFYFFFWLGDSDLNSQTWDRTPAPCIGRGNLSPWTTRAVPVMLSEVR